MASSEIDKIVCYRCYAILDVGDNYCRRCGAPTSRPTAPLGAMTPVSVPGTATGPRVGESRVVILIMLFAVLGPLALPMLWRCRCFSGTWKVILTALVLGATVAVVVLLWYAVYAVVNPLLKALGPRAGL